MSGPALTQKHAHRAIHEAAQGEAEALTDLLRKMMEAGDQSRTLEVADILIEHWETRTLRHATEEEEGLYRDLLGENPELEEKVIALIRDHDLLRKLMEKIKRRLPEKGVDHTVLAHFEAMFLVNEMHSRDEEEYLL